MYKKVFISIGFILILLFSVIVAVRSTTLEISPAVNKGCKWENRTETIDHGNLLLYRPPSFSEMLFTYPNLPYDQASNPKRFSTYAAALGGGDLELKINNITLVSVYLDGNYIPKTIDITDPLLLSSLKPGINEATVQFSGSDLIIDSFHIEYTALPANC